MKFHTIMARSFLGKADLIKNNLALLKKEGRSKIEHEKGEFFKF